MAAFPIRATVPCALPGPTAHPTGACRKAAVRIILRRIKPHLGSRGSLASLADQIDDLVADCDSAFHVLWHPIFAVSVVNAQPHGWADAVRNRLQHHPSEIDIQFEAELPKVLHRPPLGLQQDDIVELRRRLTRALAFMNERTPRYSAWVRAVVTLVVPLIYTAERVYSASSPGIPGLAYLSIPDDPMRIGEFLVHESSHIHLNMEEAMAPLYNGRDERLYWSPARREERPLFGIMLAYHAFGNMILYYRDIKANDNREIEHRDAAISEIMPQIVTLYEHLRASDGLTAGGAMIRDELARALGMF
jgi:HEXXH motif-containing protein